MYSSRERPTRSVVDSICASCPGAEPITSEMRTNQTEQQRIIAFPWNAFGITSSCQTLDWALAVITRLARHDVELRIVKPAFQRLVLAHDLDA